MPRRSLVCWANTYLNDSRRSPSSLRRLESFSRTSSLTWFWFVSKTVVFVGVGVVFASTIVVAMAVIVVVMAANVVAMPVIVVVMAAIVVAMPVIVVAMTVMGVLPFGRGWGDARISASSSWLEVLPHYLPLHPSVMVDSELVSPLLILLPFALLVVSVI